MQPKIAHCNNCHAQLRLFLKEMPKDCPKCGSLLRHEEFGKCKSCSAQVTLGVVQCEGCKSATDPTHATYAPDSPGSRGSVN